MRDTSEDLTPLLPHNVEAEQGLLGALLVNNEGFDGCGNLLPDDFFDPVHARVYTLVAKQIASGRLVSAVTLKQFFAQDLGLAEIGGPAYLARLAGAAAPRSAVPIYAQTVRDLAVRRRAMSALQQASDDLARMEDLDDTLGALEASLMDAEGSAENHPSALTASQAAEIAAERWNQAFHNHQPPGVDLGIPELTAKIGFVRPGDVIVLGGRPSMGKSAIAIEIGRRVAAAGHGVVYWCGEMAPEDNAERLMASVATAAGTAIKYYDGRQGSLTEDQMRAAFEAGREIAALPLTFVESSIKAVERLSREIRRQVRRHRAAGREDCLVIVDYLQQINTGARNSFEKVSEASQAIKALAIELRVPIILLSQLSRAVEGRESKRPMLSDLRESGQVEQDANVVIFCYRDAYYLERLAQAEPDDIKKSQLIAAYHKCKTVLDLIVAKQRSGPLDTVSVRFDGATNSVGSISASHTDYQGDLL